MRPPDPLQSGFSDYFESLSNSPRPKLNSSNIGWFCWLFYSPRPILGEGPGEKANVALEVGVVGRLAIALTVALTLALAVVGRFVTWFPFDVAADAGELLGVDGLVG